MTHPATTHPTTEPARTDSPAPAPGGPLHQIDHPKGTKRRSASRKPATAEPTFVQLQLW